MKTPINNTRKLRLLTPLFCSITVLIAGQTFAGSPSVSLNADAERGNIAESGRIGYVGGSTRVGVNIDKNMQGQVDINQIIAEDDASATSVEGWFGYQIKDKNGTKKGIKGGGVKLNHLWADGDGRYQDDTVHKVFGAYDRDANDHAKITAGYGQEQRDLFWSGYISKGISDKKSTGSGVATKAYDYGVGGEIGTFFEDSLTRIRGALDYEWGTDQATYEDKPTQATLSAGVQQYFYDSPHSLTFDISASKKAGGKSHGETTASNVRLGYQYEFGKNGTFQSDRIIKRVRVEVPGTPAVAAIPSIPAIPAIPSKPARYAKKIIKKPYTKLIKTTMKLENETFFKLNSPKLTKSAKENLLKIVAEIRRNGYKGAIRITGNTCGLGSVKYDQILSERRARSVRNFLIRQGFNPAHLIARGLGKGHPKYPNGPESGFKNRRVDIEYVFERSYRKKMYKTEYKNVLVSAAVPGRAGLPAIPGRAGIPATPARFIWKTEELKSAPIWIKRALHNPIRHKRSVDTYQTSTLAPVIPTDDYQNLQSRNQLIDVLANDSAGLILTEIVAAPAHGTATIENGKIRYIANADYTGEDHFTYEVKDASGNTSTAIVTIKIGANIPDTPNVAPIAVNDELTTDKGTAVSHDIIANDTDADGDILSLASTTTPAFGTVTQNGNVITYTPKADFSGTDSFTYVVMDGKGHEVTATVTIIVSATTNSAPTAINDSFTTDINTAQTHNVLSNDTDADGDNLIISDTTNPQNGTVEIINNQIKYTPHADYSGVDNFTYTISDGKNHTATATVTVTVREGGTGNIAPKASDDSFTTYVNTPKSYNVIDNDHDEDGDTLTITDNTDPEHGSVEITDGSIRYTPTKGHTGEDSFTYTISDGKGGTDTAAVNITIEAAPSNTAPGAGDDSITTTANTAITYNVIANDEDDDGDKLRISSNTQPDHGSVEIIDNKIKYTPETNYIGKDMFDYTISDGKGHSDTATVTITVEKAIINQAPKAEDDSFVAYMNTPIMYNVIDNDHDPEGDSLTISAKTNPQHGVVEIVDNQIKYTPSKYYTGTDRFTYTITDDKGNSDSGNVTLTIKRLNPNDSVKAKDDAFFAYVNTETTYDVLENDDDNGGTLSISSITNATHGKVTIKNNKIKYTPNTGYTGIDSFTYTISDDNGHTDTATVVITVKATNGNIAPIARNDAFMLAKGSSKTYDVVGNDFDADGDNLIISTHSTPEHGSVNIVNNQIIYKAETNYSGNDSFKYSITDNHGHTATATVNVTITGEGKPTLSPNYAATYGNIPVTIHVLADDTDPDGDTLTLVRISTAPKHGTAIKNGDNVIYTATAGYLGMDNFMYEATDNNGHTASAKVTVDIKHPIKHVGASDIYMQVIGNQAVTYDISADISDIDGHPLSVSIYGQPDKGTASVTGTIIQYTPNSDYAGSDMFDYKVCDSETPKNCDIATITVSKSAHTNTEPVISTISPFNANLGEVTQIDISSFVSDADFDTIYLSAADALSGSLTFNDLVIQYTPKEASSGTTDTINIEVRDGNGGIASSIITVNIN